MATQAFFDAGAHRYLLRIETSNEELYTKLHPRSHSWANRLRCLRELQRIGFQVCEENGGEGTHF